MTKALLGAICIAVLCGILVAGLWPFHSPRNEVTWLRGKWSSIRRPGTIMSSGEFQPPVPPESSCSIEVWVQAGAPVRFQYAAGILHSPRTQSNLRSNNRIRISC